MMDTAFFADMAWKSALIAGAALGLAAALRSRAAADRSAVLRIGALLLLLLPVVALALPSLPIAVWAAPPPLNPAVALSAGAWSADPAMGSVASPAPTIWDDPTPLLLLAYFGGLAMAGARLAGGLWTLARWTRSARPVDCPEWLAAFDRVRWAAPKGERIRLLASDAAPSPLSWGWLRPVILIDGDTLAQPEDADAILAHEVAHIARADWPALILSRLAAALFWFNPLVWKLEREIVQQAEEAADCEAVDRVAPTRYAETLLNWARANGAGLPAHAIAPSGSALGRRMKAVLDRRLRERPAGSAWTAVAILACIGIAAPVAAVELVEAKAAPRAPTPPAAAIAPIPAVAPHAPTPLVMAAVAPAPSDTFDIEIDPALSAADLAVTEVMPRIPEITASALASVDPERIARSVRVARSREHAVSRAEIDAEIAAAMREARADIARAVAESRAVSRAEIDAAMREARRSSLHAEQAMRGVRIGMAQGADGMERGAARMEAGARQMEEEAIRLRDPHYRERQIARARARGEAVTHEQLIEASDGLREGAQGMREGAREMRRSAQQMRGGRS